VTHALDGVTVLEFASYVSGPYAGMLLGDLGAEIIKVEDPKKGDPFRGWGAADYSATFGSVNRNKKSIILDLKSPEGVAAARKLAASADVIIENYRTGTMDRLGLGWDELSKANPRLVYCTITGFGTTGPYARRPGYDTVGQAMGGLLSVLTDLENPQPMGQRVETSLLASTLAFLGENAARYFEEGDVPKRKTRTQTAQVYGFVAGDDKPFVVHLSSPPKFWEGLCRVAGHPEWVSDDRFKTKADRRKAYDTLHTGFQEVFATKPRAHWLDQLLAADVPSAPIYSLDEALADPQVQHLDMVKELPHPKLGTVKLLGGAVKLSDTPAEITSCAPGHGEHTEEILKRIGMTIGPKGDAAAQ
jgi:crotonobetainyl-CoA:carnitine CoA-transferase CaiB-like acyl-CoA transferase